MLCLSSEFQESLNRVCSRLSVVGGKYGGRLDQNVNVKNYLFLIADFLILLKYYYYFESPFFL